MNSYLGFKTDYNFLESLITLDKLLPFLKEKNITTCGIIDHNLNASIPFIKLMQKNNIKPIIGLTIQIDNFEYYLFCKNFMGYQNLIKINSIMEERALTIHDLVTNHDNLILVIPYNSLENKLDTSIFREVFYSYSTEFEKKDTLSPKVYIRETYTFNKEDIKYLNFLKKISLKEINYQDTYFFEDNENIANFTDLINIELNTSKNYIPVYCEGTSSKVYLEKLALKGLNKRFNNEVKKEYLDRLNYELSVINQMNYADYFLIVYDYVLYAKKNNIYVGPGRGSACASLVSYSLGITNVDPLKYNLIFERFLNINRVTMPDIDLDFEHLKRDQVINYVKEKYGEKRVSNIITYSTLKAKVVLKMVAKALELEDQTFNNFIKLINPNLDLKTNLENKEVKTYLKDKRYQELVLYATKYENLINFPSVHAAGIIISSKDLDLIVPVTKISNSLTVAVTMEHLEELGLLKMDFLALKNLTMLHELVDEINSYDLNLNLDNISLDDPKTIKLLASGNTAGIFQFENAGMINFLKKLKIANFTDLYNALALYRPGPMDNIDTYIKRKNGLEKITYLDERLEPILKDTYGIIVYQEQIMEIMVKLANFSYSESDNVRRAISKKKISNLEEYQTKFINGCRNNNISEEVALKIFTDILKFASYGFNKAHSVSYGMLSYYLAYIKANYYKIFLKYQLNEVISNSDLTYQLILDGTKNNVKFKSVNLNESDIIYIIKDKQIVLPFTLIKNMNKGLFLEIIKNRDIPYKDIFDFVKRVNISKNELEILIEIGLFDYTKVNRKTLISNIDKIIDYGKLAGDLPDLLVPILDIQGEFSDTELINLELKHFGKLYRNHYVLKYKDPKMVSIQDVKNYFDQYITNCFYISNIKTIKTKNNHDMMIIKASDESGSIELVGFNIKTDIKVNDIIIVKGIVIKRFNEYQISVKSIKKVNNS